jgi:hypothetical protein
MPTVHAPVQLTVEHLITAVKQLPPSELREFQKKLSDWQGQNGEQLNEEETLIAVTHMRLPTSEERQLKRLGRKSERGTLTPQELEKYRSLARQAEQLNVKQIEALSELARRRGKPLRVVMKEIGWKGGEDDQASPSTRRTASRT